MKARGFCDHHYKIATGRARAPRLIRTEREKLWLEANMYKLIAGWKRSPELDEVVEEAPRWRSRKGHSKPFGILIHRFAKGDNRPWKWRPTLKQWYRTEQDRANALASLRKNSPDWCDNRFELIER